MSFIGAQPRPWVVPLLHLLASDPAVVIIQAAVSAVSFVVLAVALASLMNDWRVRVGTLALVLLLGVAPRVALWDVYLLSESLALSFTALLLAAIIWRRPIVRSRALSAGAAVIFTLWVFTRDAHLALGAMLLIGVLVCCVRERAWLLPTLMIPVLLWAVLAANNDDHIEGYNVAVNVAYRVAGDPGRLSWFHDQGMPEVDGLDPGSPLGERMRAILDDDDFRPWAESEGRSVYLRFLLRSRRFSARQFLRCSGAAAASSRRGCSTSRGPAGPR